MRTQNLFIGLVLCLLAPTAQADPTFTLNSVMQGCSNYGNQVLVGSSGTCDSDSDCRNYGNQVFVGSSYDCVGGSCPNNGIRVSVGSTVCDHGGTYACVDSYCTDGRPPQTAQVDLPGTLAVESYSFRFASADCIPKGEVKPGLGLKFTCDSSGEACGINQEPVCWTFRFVCMNGLVVVLRVWDNVVPDMPPVTRPSSCEGQPGWG